MSDAANTVIVFAPSPAADDRDDPLVCTRWMADQNIECLRANGFVPKPILDHAANRANLDAALDQPAAGIALFAHGRSGQIHPRRNDGQTKRQPIADDAIMGHDGPALDDANLAKLSGRWCHALACHAGTELAGRACTQGAHCFVGYNTALRVDWHPDDFPEPIRPLMIRLVTETTMRLAQGTFELAEIQRAVNDIADDIEIWCDEHPDEVEALMLTVTAQQLVQRLIVRRLGETS